MPIHAEKYYLWITDPHLDTFSVDRFKRYFAQIREQNPTALLISGDISTGKQINHHLKLMSDTLSLPIYFVLGNHDYYGSDVDTVKASIITSNQLRYLEREESIELDSSTALIGHDGWYDAMWRIPLTPLIFSWDFLFIRDFRRLKNNAARMNLVRQKAKESAQFLRLKLLHALQQYDHVYLLTHFPIWPEQTNRYLRDEFWKPYNSSKILAETLENVMNEYPNKSLTVLAGHTHNFRIETRQNIKLVVGPASRDESIIPINIDRL